MILDHLFKFDRALAIDPNVKIPDNIGGTDASIDSVMNLVTITINIALNIAVVVGVIMILYSAFLYVSSFGEESKAETAKKTLLWSIIGTAVVFLARILVNVINKYLG